MDYFVTLLASLFLIAVDGQVCYNTTSYISYYPVTTYYTEPEIDYYESCGWWSCISKTRTVFQKKSLTSYVTFTKHRRQSSCCTGFTGFPPLFCYDKNECSINNGECEQNCHNTKGSYYCSCDSGYILSTNKKDCDASLSRYVRRSITDDNDGLDFYVGVMRNLEGYTSNFSLYISNLLERKVNYTIESNSTITSGTISVGDSHVVGFSNSTVTLDSSYSYRNQGIHVHSDGQILLLVVNYRPSTIGLYSAYPHQIFPITEYQYYAVSIRSAMYTISEILLVGNMDNTTITITPTADVVLPSDIHSADSANETVHAGTTKTVKLNRLQTFLFGSALVDLSGTSIVSDKPLTVISGHECGTIPYNFGSCDHVSVQIPPTVAWGKTFILTPHKGRTSGQYFKLISSENTTTVMHNCDSGISTIELAFAGDVNTIYTNYTTYCYLESDKPLLVIQMMHGNTTDEDGGPSFSTVLPTDQYKREIVFFIQNTQTYQHYINIIATEQDTIKMDGSVLSLSWKEIRDLNNEVVGYATHMAITSNWDHVITSDNNVTFSVLVYGFASCIGYSYTAGVAAFNICMIDNGGCDHNCCNTGNNYYCTCNDGYVLSSDGNTCQDIKSQEHTTLTTYGSEFYVGFYQHFGIDDTHQFYIHTFKTTPVSFNVTSLDGVFNYTGTCTHLNPAIVDVPFSYQVSSYDYSWRSKGLRISSLETEPISVIGRSHHSGGDFMAYLAYPCHIQPTSEYIYYAVSSFGLGNSKSQFLIVGCHDNSGVTIIPTGNITLPIDAQDVHSGTIILTAGENHTLVLHSMQTLLIFASHFDLTASKIISNKPLTVLSGHEASRVPLDVLDADPIITQVPPTIVWGKRFLLSPHSGRTRQSYRIIANMDNTVIIRKCGSDVVVNSTLYADQWSQFFTNGSVYCSVVSDNPIYVAQLGVGSVYNGSTSGDPSCNTVAPMEQYINSIQYTTLTADSHFYSVVMPNDEYYNGTLIFDGSLQTISGWNSIYYSDGSIAGYGYSAITTGSHIITHPNERGKLFVSVYGWGTFRGYSYASGMSLNALVSTGCEVNNGGCEHNCINDTLGSYFCTCNESYTLNLDYRTCQPTCSNPCGNCFSCIYINQCQCIDGWTGDNCCTDTDECSEGMSNCSQVCINTDGSFTCGCNDGYLLDTDGTSCNDIDECSEDIDSCSQMCINTDGNFTCECSDGYQLDIDGTSCNDIDECSEVDSCSQMCTNTDGNFTCGCNIGYLLDTDGTTCNDIDECNENTDGCSQMCTNTDGSFTCGCNIGYLLDTDGTTCKDIDECSEGTNDCSQTCTNTNGNFACGCNNGYLLDSDGRTCSVSCYTIDCCDCEDCYDCCDDGDCSNDVCQSEIDAEFGIEWNKANVSETVESNCPPGKTGVAKRTCLMDGMWSNVDIDLCISEIVLNIAAMVSDLLSENNTQTVEEQNEIISYAVQNLTMITKKNETSSYISDVANIVATTTDIITVLTLNLGDENITNPLLVIGLLDVYNNVLDESYEETWSIIGTGEGGSEQLMENIESFGNYAGMFSIVYNSTLNIELENIVLKVETPDLTVNPNDIIFPLVSENGTYNENEGFAQIRIPHEHLTERYNSTNDKVAVVNALVRNIVTYLPYSTTNEQQAATHLISTQIVSDIKSSNIDVILNFTTKYIITATNPQCVFWNFSLGVNDTGDWSTDGIEVVKIAEIDEYEYHVICNSSHVTPFTILVNIHQVEINEKEYRALNVVSYIGLVVSSLCSILTIILLLLLRSELIKTIQYFIHLNLSIALLSLYTVFCFGIDSTIVDITSSKIVCTVVAAVIHYLIIASFTWMLCEAILLFILLVIVFSSVRKKWYLFLLAGWDWSQNISQSYIIMSLLGVPTIPVALSLAVFHDDYGVEGEFCWIDFSNEAAMWLFLGPIILILIINFVIFVLAFRIIIRHQRKKEDSIEIKKTGLALAKQSVVAIVTLVPLLGLTWVFGLLIVNQQSTVFAWLFTFCSCFQGAFILLFNIIRNEKIRSKLADLMCSQKKSRPKLMDVKRRAVIDSSRAFLIPTTNRLSTGLGPSYSSDVPINLNPLYKGDNSNIPLTERRLSEAERNMNFFLASVMDSQQDRSVIY